HVPGELGWYDQRLPEVLRQQIGIARQYGIFGFCFQYYWYAGQDRFARPLRQLLADPTLDISFCLAWANGISRHEWELSAIGVPEASRDASREESFLDSIWDALCDPRCIRIDGKPLVIVLQPHLL